MAETCLSERLYRTACDARAFLEPHWAEWHRHAGSPTLKTLSQGTCGRSSLFLRDVLRSEGLSAEFVAGSPGEGRQGFHYASVWYGHAWVECAGWIVDITADQFGAPPVIVTYVNDARYRAGEDTAAPQFLARRQKVAARLIGEWKRHKQGVQHET